MYRLSSILFLFALSGCGGSDDKSSNNGSNTGSNSVQSINTQDVVKFMRPATSATFSLENYVELSSNSSNLRLRDMTPVLNESSPDYCSGYHIEGITVSINPTDVIGECVYLYTAEADGVTAEPSLLRVVFSNGETGPIRLAETTSIGEKITIDLSSHIPSGYSLDKESILLLGAGSVRSIEYAENTIEYTAGQSDGDAGVSRILVNMKSEVDNKVVIATIDVAVSDVGVNHAPLAFNFRYGDTSTFVPGAQLAYQPIGLGEEVVIDIAPYFNKGFLDSDGQRIEMINDKGQYFYDDNGEQINFYMESDGYTTTDIYRSGLTLVDPDKHPVQLIDVFSYNASVSPSQMAGEYTSTKFKFKSYTAGLNYVTYVLSDHNGGYATGILEIRVLKAGSIVSKPWKSQLNTPDGKYLSPIDYASAIEGNIAHSGSSNEDGFDGPLGASTALYTYDEARYFCIRQGLELPTETDLYNLERYFPKGLYNSLDAYSENENLRNQKIGWPVTEHYWLQVPSSVTYVKTASLVNYSTKIAYLADFGELQKAGATCISRYKIDSYTIERDRWAYKFPHDNRTVLVKVKVKKYDGSDAPGAAIKTSQPPYIYVGPIPQVGYLSSTSVVPHSYLAEQNQKIKLIVGLDEMEVDGLEFRDIPKYVRPKENLTTENGKTNLCYYSSIEKMAQGNCSQDNGMEYNSANWQGLGTDSFFFDGNSAYRIWGNVIYNTRGFSGSASGPTYAGGYTLGRHTVSRTDTFKSINPMLYDGQYYWIVNEAKARVEAYKRIVDLAKQVNMIKSVEMVANSNMNGAFVYDPIEKVYWRLNSSIPGNTPQLRSYTTIEDAASETNFIREIPFSSTGGRTFTVLE
ncbi:TPA: hypothetical protein RQN15_000324 [Aeromonas hydrophila]|nr:hypothetical protein [Aeromonas hydrophila]